MDPEFGWMHARIQTWFPFCIHVCIVSVRGNHLFQEWIWW
jgi:hypothetical protein